MAGTLDRFVGRVTTYVAMAKAMSHMPARIAMGAPPRAKKVVMKNEMKIAVTAITFAFTVNPSPLRHPSTMLPKKRLLINQVSNRSDDLEKKKAARSIGPVVGMIGARIPMKAMPTQIQPRTRNTDLRARLRTSAMSGEHTGDCSRQRVGSMVGAWILG